MKARGQQSELSHVTSGKSLNLFDDFLHHEVEVRITICLPCLLCGWKLPGAQPPVKAPGGSLHGPVSVCHTHGCCSGPGGELCLGKFWFYLPVFL